MTEHWKNRLKTIVDSNAGLTMKGLSLSAGLSETAVRDMLVRSKGSQIENFLAIAHAANVDPCWLLLGEGGRDSMLVSGNVVEGDRCEFPQYPRNSPLAPDEYYGTVAVEMRSESPLALTIETNDLAPAYYKGDIIVVSKVYGVDIDNIIGRECVASYTNADGEEEACLKFVHGHNQANRYTLRSRHPHEQDIEGIELEWAAPINWIKRNR